MIKNARASGGPFYITQPVEGLKKLELVNGKWIPCTTPHQRSSEATTTAAAAAAAAASSSSSTTANTTMATPSVTEINLHLQRLPRDDGGDSSATLSSSLLPLPASSSASLSAASTKRTLQKSSNTTEDASRNIRTTTTSSQGQTTNNHTKIVVQQDSQGRGGRQEKLSTIPSNYDAMMTHLNLINWARILPKEPATADDEEEEEEENPVESNLFRLYQHNPQPRRLLGPTVTCTMMAGLPSNACTIQSAGATHEDDGTKTPWSDIRCCTSRNEKKAIDEEHSSWDTLWFQPSSSNIAPTSNTNNCTTTASSASKSPSSNIERNAKKANDEENNSEKPLAKKMRKTSADDGEKKKLNGDPISEFEKYKAIVRAKDNEISKLETEAMGLRSEIENTKNLLTDEKRQNSLLEVMVSYLADPDNHQYE